ncbi:MAG: hypothetical protein ABIJ11_03005 [Elusimicrobiota bacterium]
MNIKMSIFSILLLSCLLAFHCSVHASTIAVCSFDAGDTMGYTITDPLNVGTTSFGPASTPVYHSTTSWIATNLDGPGSGGADAQLTFSTVTVTGYTNVFVSMWLNTNQGGFEAADYMKGEILVNGGTWQIFFSTAEPDGIIAWTQFSTNVVAGANTVCIRWTANNNAAAEKFYLDYVTITGLSGVSDSTAPASVTDLAGQPGASGGQIQLTWSAPGDDGSIGALDSGSSFKIQYSTWSGVTWSTSSAQITVSTSGVAPGTRVSYTAGGLTEGDTYYLKIWHGDETPNWSGLSNTATSYAQTSGPPPPPSDKLYFRWWNVRMTEAPSLYGDCQFFEFPGPDGEMSTKSDNRYLLFDSGPTSTPSSMHLDEFLNNIVGLPPGSTIHGFIVGSYGADHMAGAVSLTDPLEGNYKIKTAYENIEWPAGDTKTNYYTTRSQILSAGGTFYNLNAGDIIGGANTNIATDIWGSYGITGTSITIKCISANPNTPIIGDNDNQWGLVLLVSMGSFKGILTGDVEGINAQEESIWSNGVDPVGWSYAGVATEVSTCAIGYMGHHGAQTEGSSRQEWWDATKPQYILQEDAGASLHPYINALSSAAVFGLGTAKIYRIDHRGDMVKLISDAGHMNIIPIEEVNVNDNDDAWSDIRQPAITALVVDLTVTGRTETTVTLNWTPAIPGLYKYDVFYSTALAGDCGAGAYYLPGTTDPPVGIYIKDSTGPVLAGPYTVDGLETGKTYFFRLSATWNFPNNTYPYERRFSAATSTTTVGTANQDPNPPSELAQYGPVWQSWPVGDWKTYTQIRTTFTITDPDSVDTVKFNIQFSTRPDFSWNYIDTTSSLIGTTPQTTNYFTPLLFDATWYWRVRCGDDGGLWSSYSSMTVAGGGAGRHFGIDTTPPTIPVMITPSDYYTTNYLTIAFDWDDSTDTLNGVSNYTLRVSTAQDFTGIVYSSVAANSNATIGLSQAQWFWCVRSSDTLGNYSSFSSTWTVFIDTTPPASIVNLSALPGTYPGEILLTWTSSGDDFSAGTIIDGIYRVRYSTYITAAADFWTDSPSNWPDFQNKYQIDWTTSTPAGVKQARTLTGLSEGATYYVRVWTRDEIPGTSDDWLGNWSDISNGATSQAQVTNLGVSIDITNYDFGTLQVGISSITASSATVVNDGNVTANWTIRATTNTAGTPWQLSSSADIDRFILWSVFNSTRAVASDFGDEDKLSYNYQVCTSTYFAANQNGEGVPADENRVYWWKIQMPSVSNTAVQQSILIEINAEAP